jgi:hypothetical protein
MSKSWRIPVLRREHVESHLKPGAGWTGTDPFGTSRLSLTELLPIKEFRNRRLGTQGSSCSHLSYEPAGSARLAIITSRLFAARRTDPSGKQLELFTRHASSDADELFG